MERICYSGDRSRPRSLFDLDLARIPEYGTQYGLYFPEEPTAATAVRIAASNSLDGLWDVNALRDIVPYYLFYPVLVALQYDTFCTDHYPFRHFPRPLPESVGPGNRRNLRVLLAGCGSEETAVAGYELASLLFGKDHLHTYEVIDICTIPIKRIVKLNELAPFVSGVELRARVQRIGRAEQEATYDVILTDRLLGSSIHESYDIDILRQFRRLLKEDGVLLTMVEATRWAVLSAEPQVPGKLCHEYFCERFGRCGARDAKIGLTLEQWDEMARLYNLAMKSTYFSDSGTWRIKTAADAVALFRAAGIEKYIATKINSGNNNITYERLDLDSANLKSVDGSLAICAWR